jgi:hypothetical protein
MTFRIVTISDGYESANVPAISLPGGVEPQVVYKSLSASEASTGLITLSAVPNYEERSKLSWNGIVQFYGQDFEVFGTQLQIKARLLSLLQTGDEIVIQTI